MIAWWDICELGVYFTAHCLLRSLAVCVKKIKEIHSRLRISIFSMERWVNRVALVTGASVGIGAAVSATLVKHGLTVIGCGRNLDKLKISIQCYSHEIIENNRESLLLVLKH